MKQPCVYIVTNKPNGTLYVGVTSALPKRACEHRIGAVEGFSKKYGLKRLVYVSPMDTMADAIALEKRLKKWRRAWKIALIEQANPEWRDLYSDVLR